MADQVFKKRISKKLKIEIALVVAIIILAATYLIWDIVAGGPLTQLFNNREELIRIVDSLGPLGPLAYIGLQILQTVVAPIPGNAVGAIGGLLFGWWGILWTTIGATIGATLVFWVSRHFGRALVEKLVKKESLDKFDFVIGKRASVILFLIFLIPGLPDDIVCYVAGLTDVPIKKLIVIFALGRLPAVVGNNVIGTGLNEGNIGLVVALVAIGAVIFAILYKQQENIMRLLGRQSVLEQDNKALRHDLEDYADDGELNNSIAKKSKKS